jgi:hypothetical protein
MAFSVLTLGVCIWLSLPSRHFSVLTFVMIVRPVTVAARFMAWVSGRSSAEIVGSNPTRGLNVCCECCVLSSRGLCDELITRPEKSYWVWCVVVCDLETLWMRRPWTTGGCCVNQKKIIIADVSAWPNKRMSELLQVGGQWSKQRRHYFCVLYSVEISWFKKFPGSEETELS